MLVQLVRCDWSASPTTPPREARVRVGLSEKRPAKGFFLVTLDLLRYHNAETAKPQKETRPLTRPVKSACWGKLEDSREVPSTMIFLIGVVRTVLYPRPRVLLYRPLITLGPGQTGSQASQKGEERREKVSSVVG